MQSQITSKWHAHVHSIQGLALEPLAGLWAPCRALQKIRAQQVNGNTSHLPAPGLTGQPGLLPNPVLLVLG